MQHFDEDNQSAVEAREHLQSLAFGPIAFQAARALVNLGILSIIEKCRRNGITTDEVSEKTKLPVYGVRVLMEAGLGLGLLTIHAGRFQITKAGWFLLHDRMTRVNFDFVNDICYRGMIELEMSVAEGRPKGLKVFGEWPTIYEALAHLPERAKASWLNFDHFYSDAAFPEALPLVFGSQPRRLLDIGGNTGRWALECVQFSKDVRVCIADLPGQLRMAEQLIQSGEGSDRISYVPVNVLDKTSVLPAGFDAIWMSQFLDCFAEDQIRAILAKCRKAMEPGGRLFILEPFWDRQRFKASAFSLQMTSLYFTAMANGNSQMYRSDLLLSLLEKEGFTVEEQFDQLGISHTLLICRCA